MTEQLISFETAKLAKEKGFDIPVIKYYTPKGYDTESSDYMTDRYAESNWNNGLGSYPTKPCEVECSAPTQSLLQKWLREKYILIEISPVYDWNTWGFMITLKDISSPFYEIPWNEIEYPTYESALEAGLFEALKLVTDEK